MNPTTFLALPALSAPTEEPATGSPESADDRPAAAFASVPDQTLLNLLRALERQPDGSQRELARDLGMSLGKVNYCLKALLAKGWVKAQNVRKSQNKVAYLYLLTPAGVAEKSSLTARFLKRKVAEYEALEHEIELLRREVEDEITSRRRGGIVDQSGN